MPNPLMVQLCAREAPTKMELHRFSTIHKCLCKRNDQQIKSLTHLAPYGIINMHVLGGWWWWCY
jgi:hypothetical protein